MNLRLGGDLINLYPRKRQHDSKEPYLYVRPNGSRQQSREIQNKSNVAKLLLNYL